MADTAAPFVDWGSGSARQTNGTTAGSFDVELVIDVRPNACIVAVPR